jgi:hypothetical protein
MPTKELKKQKFKPSSTPTHLNVTVTAPVEMEEIGDLVIAAFGSCGAGDWATIKKAIKPKPPFAAKDDDYGQLEYPFHKGGALLIALREDSGVDDVDGKTEWTLNLKTIQSGLEAYAKADPKGFMNWIANPDSADGPASDRFLQYCLFGKVEF